MDWNRHDNGAGWRVLEDGRIALEGGRRHASPAFRGYLWTDRDGCPRTKGAPVTAQTLLEEYGFEIRRAANTFDLPVSWVAAMITIEADLIPGTRSFDPVSIADEDYRAGKIERELHRYRDRPHRVSAGLMQTLIETARRMYAKCLLSFPGGLHGPDGLDIPDLCIPSRSILLGAAYMADRADEYGLDPVLLVGAYNAGGVYTTSSNPWRIRTHGRDRIPKFVAYHNDLVEVLR